MPFTRPICIPNSVTARSMQRVDVPRHTIWLVGHLARVEREAAIEPLCASATPSPSVAIAHSGGNGLLDSCSRNRVACDR